MSDIAIRVENLGKLYRIGQTVGYKTLREVMPDHVLLLTWNSADEIMEQQAEYRQRGGRLIRAIPELRVE